MAKQIKTRFRLSLRTLLILVTAFSIWIGMQANRKNQFDKSMAEVRRLNGSIEYDFQRDAKITGVSNLEERKRWSLMGDRVVGLALDLGQVRDDDLAGLTGLKDLQFLTIDSTHVTDKGIAHLGSFRRLRNLRLINTKTSDDGLSILSSMPDVESLCLPQRSTGACVKHLPHPERLLNLDLSYSHVTDESLESLERCVNLESLSLENTRIGDAGIRHLIRLKNLKWVGLSDTRISDVSLHYLSALTNLTDVWLGHTNITDSGLESLKGLHQLRTLHIGGTKIEGRGLIHLTELKKLTSVDFYSWRDLNWSKRDVEALRRVSKLMPTTTINHPALNQPVGFR